MNVFALIEIFLLYGLGCLFGFGKYRSKRKWLQAFPKWFWLYGICALLIEPLIPFDLLPRTYAASLFVNGGGVLAFYFAFFWCKYMPSKMAILVKKLRKQKENVI